MNYRNIIRQLVERIRDLEAEVIVLHDELEEAEDYEDARETFARVREEIRKGDSEYALLLIDREIGA
ncbi:hypothetical protein CN072_27350 [Sinorhizobium meliloti]|uniref:hypothetical protein n=1 Tax=Rhizobium meliloti TaxID=382 RepID=UPI000FD4FB07|nr:hypothetical protein [Sinorhizobium meliloti]RVP80657.1 hypothetical protein CN072_27350 [Sinorhizobium meliloti]